MRLSTTPASRTTRDIPDWFSPAQLFGYAAFVLGVGCFLQTDDRRFK